MTHHRKSILSKLFGKAQRAMEDDRHRRSGSHDSEHRQGHGDEHRHGQGHGGYDEHGEGHGRKRGHH